MAMVMDTGVEATVMGTGITGMEAIVTVTVTDTDMAMAMAIIMGTGTPTGTVMVTGTGTTMGTATAVGGVVAGMATGLVPAGDGLRTVTSGFVIRETKSEKGRSASGRRPFGL